MSTAGKFVVKTASNGEVDFRLQAGNGEAILKSEMYASKASALNRIESVRKNATDDARYERKTAASGQFTFNLKATRSAARAVTGPQCLRPGHPRNLTPTCQPRLLSNLYS